MVLAEDLRQAVLQAALQGKLTEQLDTDSDVDEMLLNMQKEKKHLLDRKNAREEKIIPIEEEEEKPYVIPQNWRWEKLGNIGIYKKGPFGSALTKSIFVPKSANTVKVYEQKNAIQKDAYLGEYYITKEYFDSKMKGFVVESGDIIVSCAGTIGETYIMPDNIEFGIINQALMRMNIVQSLNIAYFLMYFDNVLKTEAQKGSKGSAIKNIPPFEVFKQMFIPIPPIEEQQRIVDKINEIMPKIDEYEKIEKELETLKKEFPTNMKDALLQAAMQGKLTEQLESDGSVDELLEAIRQEKEELIAQKKIKKEKAIPDIEEEEIPFDIPENWRWVRLKNITYSGGQKIPNKCFSYIDIGSIDNVHQKLNNEDNIIEADKAPSRARKIVKYGDVLYATVRPYLHNMCIIDRNFKEEPIASTGFAVMTCCKGILNKFLLFYMLSPEFDRYANSTENAKGMAYPAINDDKFYRALIPIPPIEEQQRIAERLEVLLPLCEDLKEV